jgi:hypothetical protein
VVAFLGEDGPCSRTNLVQLGTDLVLDLVELGQTCLELRSHSIKIYKAFHSKGKEGKEGKEWDDEIMWSVELQEDLALGLILDGLTRSLDKLFHREDLPYSLLEDIAILYYVPLGLL